jgi:TFIIF-interacting CTD phosphatase-like protein
LLELGDEIDFISDSEISLSASISSLNSEESRKSRDSFANRQNRKMGDKDKNKEEEVDDEYYLIDSDIESEEEYESEEEKKVYKKSVVRDLEKDLIEKSSEKALLKQRDVCELNYKIDKKVLQKTFKLIKKLRAHIDDEVAHEVCLGETIFKKTVVLDLDGTLIHRSVDSDSVYLRPNLYEFLTDINQLFEVIVFTAADHEWAHTIIELIDPDKQYFAHVFSREYCFYSNQCFVKDLRIFQDRNLRDIILVDDNIASFAFQLDNGIPVPTFTGAEEEENDDYLLSVFQFLYHHHLAHSFQQVISKYIGIQQYYNNYSIKK